MVLIGLLQKQFFQNLQTEKFPSHVIVSRKQDLLEIQGIDFNYLLSGVNLTATSIDFSNLEELSNLILMQYFLNKKRLLIFFNFKN